MRFAIALLLSVLSLQAVQPFPGGVRITWDSASNDLSYSVWRLPPGTTNWQFVVGTTNTTAIYTNTVIEGTMFGVTSIQRMSNGQCCVASDVGIAGWPPSLPTPQNSVRLTPTNGFLVATGQWVKVSSDMAVFDDWLRFIPLTNGIRVEHKASPLKPRLFMAYPVNPTPPMPGTIP